MAVILLLRLFLCAQLVLRYAVMRLAIRITAQSGSPVAAVASTISLQQPVPAEPYLPHPAVLSRQRLDSMVEGGWAMCPDLLVIPSSGKPIRCFSCHGTIADVHAAHTSRSVVRLEVECGSTRSRMWFDSKQNVVRLEVESGSA